MQYNNNIIIYPFQIVDIILYTLVYKSHATLHMCLKGMLLINRVVICE